MARHTLNLSEANKTISELAETDALTALANRRVFTERLDTAFAAAKRGGPGFAVLYFDLDHFKDVNDTLGHLLGDALLRAVADRVRGALRKNDVVARFGGDEFAVLQHNAPDAAAAEKLAAIICDAVAAPYLIDGNEIHISASIGISPYARDISRPEVMMIQADLALYRAKQDGRNCFRFHSARHGPRGRGARHHHRRFARRARPRRGGASLPAAGGAAVRADHRHGSVDAVESSDARAHPAVRFHSDRGTHGSDPAAGTMGAG